MSDSIARSRNQNEELWLISDDKWRALLLDYELPLVLSSQPIENSKTRLRVTFYQGGVIARRNTSPTIHKRYFSRCPYFSSYPPVYE